MQFNLAGQETLVYPVGLGGRFGERSPELSNRILDAFVQAGGNLIDTAHCYVDGESEREIGRWIRRNGMRDNIILVDKGGHPEGELEHRVGPEYILQDIEESLDRLGTDYIDVYLAHRDDESVPVDEIVSAFVLAREKGWVRGYGFSNWTLNRLQEAIAWAHWEAVPTPVLLSNQMSLARQSRPMWPGTQSISSEDLEWLKQEQFPLLAWSSLAKGWFTGRYADPQNCPQDIMEVYHHPLNLARLESALELGLAKRMTPVQVALSYVISQPFPVVALIGPESVEELNESMQINPLRPDEIEFLFQSETFFS